MKIHILNTICLLYSFTSCYAQEKTNVDNSNFVKELEKEIASAVFNNNLFNDTVTFVIKEQVTHDIEGKLKENNWGKVKVLFQETDYVVNPYDINNNKYIIKVLGLGKYYELKNHNHIYIIGLKNGKISLVQEIEIKLPSDAPPPDPR